MLAPSIYFIHVGFELKFVNLISKNHCSSTTAVKFFLIELSAFRRYHGAIFPPSSILELAKQVKSSSLSVYFLLLAPI